MEMLINSTNEMKHEAHGTQQPGHINKIGEDAGAAQRSDSLMQLINQRFPSNTGMEGNRYDPVSAPSTGSKFSKARWGIVCLGRQRIFRLLCKI